VNTCRIRRIRGNRGALLTAADGWPATKPEASGLHSALRSKIIALAGNEHARSGRPLRISCRSAAELVVEPNRGRACREILRPSSEPVWW